VRYPLRRPTTVPGRVVGPPGRVVSRTVGTDQSSRRIGLDHGESRLLRLILRAGQGNGWARCRRTAAMQSSYRPAGNWPLTVSTAR
jgi:hypothetical protein